MLSLRKPAIGVQVGAREKGAVPFSPAPSAPQLRVSTQPAKRTWIHEFEVAINGRKDI